MCICEVLLKRIPSPKCLFLDLLFPRYSPSIVYSPEGVIVTRFLSLVLYFNNLSGCLYYSTLITLFQLISRALFHSSIYTATPSFNAITCLSGATGSAVAVGEPGTYSHFCFLVLPNQHSRQFLRSCCSIQTIFLNCIPYLNSILLYVNYSI
jgi:hypothetical protein